MTLLWSIAANDDREVALEDSPGVGERDMTDNRSKDGRQIRAREFLNED